MSAVWSGHLHFGLVVMPVRLLVAARAKTTRFKRLQRKPINRFLPETPPPSVRDDDSDVRDESRRTSEAYLSGSGEGTYEYAPVRQVLQSAETSEEVRTDELFKGYEHAPNEFVAIDPGEVKAADVETSDTIDLFHFVKGTEVDPIYFERSYYVAPDSGAEKVYALLSKAMRKEECSGIARIGMHRREHMLILRPGKDCLVAHTMFYANEVRPAPRLELDGQFSEKELSMALALIKGYSGEFDPKQFKDLYQERLQKIIDAQMSSTERRPQAATPQPLRKIPDLMESIRLSLAQIEGKQPQAKATKKQAQRTTPVTKKKPQKVRA